MLNNEQGYDVISIAAIKNMSFKRTSSDLHAVCGMKLDW